MDTGEFFDFKILSKIFVQKFSKNYDIMIEDKRTFTGIVPKLFVELVSCKRFIV